MHPVIVIDETDESTPAPQSTPFNPVASAIAKHIQNTKNNEVAKRGIDSVSPGTPGEPTAKLAKKVPNIAEELAMNRNNSKALSPTPIPMASSPFNGELKPQPLVERVITTTNKEKTPESKPKPKPRAKSKPKATPVVSTTVKSPSPVVVPNNKVVEAANSRVKQVKISSLLSSDEPKIEHTSSAPPIPIITKKKTTPPPVSKTPPLINITLTNTKNSVATSHKATTTASAKTTTSTIPKKVPTTTTKPALVRTKSNTTGNSGTTASKKNSTAGVTKASKSKSATALDSMKKKTTAKKNSDQDKKKTNDNAQTPIAEPPKLAAAPPIEKPDLLSTISKPKTASVRDSRISIVNIPLYSSSSNEYLDENGTVTFNLFQLLKEKEQLGSTAEAKAQKRKKLLTENHQPDNLVEEATDIDSNDDLEDNEEEENGDEKKSTEPKKKAHPMKGKNLIGKYDFEDPFIDDTEMLWEEQRASTKDGFFVFFGPLIAKGQSASFERANGTMKRGGIKK